MFVKIYIKIITKFVIFTLLSQSILYFKKLFLQRISK